MTIAEKQKELVAVLSGINNSQDRFAWLVKRGREHFPLDAPQKTDAVRVAGCLAKVWLVTEFSNGKCYFRTDSDSAIVKGIAAVLCEFYSDQTPAEVLTVSPAFLELFGINQHLTPNRRNSLSRIFEKIRNFAEGHIVKKVTSD